MIAKICVASAACSLWAIAATQDTAPEADPSAPSVAVRVVPFADHLLPEKFLELDKASPHALLNLAFYLAGPRKDADQTSITALRAARDFLARSLETLPKDASVLVALANIHL